MIIRFSGRARRAFDRILDDLADRASPRIAMRMAGKIEPRCLSLDELPERGARFGRQELSSLRYLVETPYVIVYRLAGDAVEIVTIVHGSRDIERLLLRTKL